MTRDDYNSIRNDYIAYYGTAVGFEEWFKKNYIDTEMALPSREGEISRLKALLKETELIENYEACPSIQQRINELTQNQ